MKRYSPEWFDRRREKHAYPGGWGVVSFTEAAFSADMLKLIRKEVKAKLPQESRITSLMKIGREVYGTAAEVEKMLFKGRKIYHSRMCRIVTGLQRNYRVRVLWLWRGKAHYHLNDVVEALQQNHRGRGRKIVRVLRAPISGA